MEKKKKEKTTEELIEDFFSLLGVLRSGFVKNHEKDRDCNVMHSNYMVLGILMKLKSSTMSNLGKKLGISNPNMTAITDHLIKDGFVRREYDESDRRIINIHITKKGEETMKRILGEHFKKMFSGLSHADIVSLSKSIKNITKVMLKLKK